jgi:hypothetical protein
MTTEQLRELVEGLTEIDLRTLRAIINGKLSKRKITSEQQAKMQKGRKKNPPERDQPNSHCSQCGKDFYSLLEKTICPDCLAELS